MSEVRVNKLSPRSGTTVTLGDSGDTISIPSGVTLANSGTIDNLNADNLTSGTVPSARISGAYTGITNLTMSGDLTVDTSTLKVDSTNNRVGIGTTSPTSLLHLKANAPYITFEDDDNNQDWQIQAASWFAFRNQTTNSELMRINSSGDLMVGTTANLAGIGGSSTQGVALSSGSYGGLVAVSRSGNPPIIANRQTSDGTIIDFRKDGTTVGSINVTSTGIGIYLGGTGTPNRLDDYEEGTWTPVFAGGTTAGTYTYTTQVGTYTKIGRLVTVNCDLLDITQSSAGSGSVRINGLPFTSSSTCNSLGSVSLDKFTFTGYDYCVANVGPSKGFAYIWKIRQSNTDGLLQVSDRDQDGSDLKFTITYEV